MNRYSCPVCGEYKTKTAIICQECNQLYGERDEWPQWLCYVVADADREIKSDSRRQERELPLEETGDSMWSDTPLYFGGKEEYVILRYPQTGDGIRISVPYAPYGNADDNRRYRRANGIQERD